MSDNIVKVLQTELGISEPNPVWFGNKPNPQPKPSTWSAESDNWLKSRFHFNFAEWSGGRGSYGVLRVLNDDLVQSGCGFGTHPHGNMEICTYVVDGDLTHQDSMGTAETLTRGAVQFMTAGVGVRHSERNGSRERPLRFIQMWIVPRKAGLAPNYGSFQPTSAEQRLNKLHWLVGDVKSDASNEQVPIKINQDAKIYVTELDGTASEPVKLNVADGRQAYVLQIEGQAQLSGDVSLARHEAAMVRGPVELQLTALDTAANGNAHVLVVEMKSM